MLFRNFWSGGRSRKTKRDVAQYFRGKPRVREVSDSGERGLELYASYVSPGFAQFGENVAKWGSIFLGTDMLLLSLEAYNLQLFMVSMAMVFGFWLVARQFFLWVFSRILCVRLFRDRVDVAGWFGFETYPILGGYIFALDYHEKAAEKYYGESLNLQLEYGGESVQLASVYPGLKAKKLAGRLNNMIDYLQKSR